MVRKQEEGDRLRYKKSGLLFMAALRVSNQAKEKKQKARISGLSFHFGAAAPLRILLCLLTVWSVSC